MTADTLIQSPEQEHATAVVAEYLRTRLPPDSLLPKTVVKPVPWIESNFYIPETQEPIVLKPHQKSIINLALNDDWNFQTVVYSTIKKSGKTAAAGAIARYLAENSGHRAEVMCVAHDREQARGRSYQALLSSIELNPKFNRVRKELPGIWNIIERHAIHLPTNSIVRAISNDHMGEAGSNPVCTLWTEIWNITTEAGKRLWTELTPVPTRKRSLRVIETYAGYEDESKILYDIYESGMKHGRRLTHSEIYWPFEDQPPIWINEKARLMMYWDTGVEARRMPWQTEEYYEIQKNTPGLTLHEYERLHENRWISSTNEFLPIEWWQRLKEILPTLGAKQPAIMAVDAGVSSDCCVLVIVTRHPAEDRKDTDVAVRRYRIWKPTKHNKVDFAEVKQQIREWCKEYNIVQLCYDPYQMHQMAQEIVREAITWVYEFSQGTSRLIADKQLYDVIKDKHIAHDGDPEMEEHIRNAAAKKSLEDNDRIRIVKKSEDKKIDYTVALSMAVHECLRLVLT